MTQHEKIIAVKVLPKSSRNQIVGWENEELKVKITAAPDKGEANSALIEFLAKEWKISKRSIKLLSGKTSRHKRLSVTLNSGEEIL